MAHTGSNSRAATAQISISAKSKGPRTDLKCDEDQEREDEAVRIAIQQNVARPGAPKRAPQYNTSWAPNPLRTRVRLRRGKRGLVEGEWVEAEQASFALVSRQPASTLTPAPIGVSKSPSRYEQGRAAVEQRRAKAERAYAAALKVRGARGDFKKWTDSERDKRMAQDANRRRVKAAGVNMPRALRKECPFLFNPSVLSKRTMPWLKPAGSSSVDQVMKWASHFQRTGGIPAAADVHLLLRSKVDNSLVDRLAWEMVGHDVQVRVRMAESMARSAAKKGEDVGAPVPRRALMSKFLAQVEKDQAARLTSDNRAVTALVKSELVGIEENPGPSERVHVEKRQKKAEAVTRGPTARDRPARGAPCAKAPTVSEQDCPARLKLVPTEMAVRRCPRDDPNRIVERYRGARKFVCPLCGCDMNPAPVLEAMGFHIPPVAPSWPQPAPDCGEAHEPSAPPGPAPDDVVALFAAPAGDMAAEAEIDPATVPCPPFVEGESDEPMAPLVDGVSLDGLRWPWHSNVRAPCAQDSPVSLPAAVAFTKEITHQVYSKVGAPKEVGISHRPPVANGPGRETEPVESTFLHPIGPQTRKPNDLQYLEGYELTPAEALVALQNTQSGPIARWSVWLRGSIARTVHVQYTGDQRLLADKGVEIFKSNYTLQEISSTATTVRWWVVTLFLCIASVVLGPALAFGAPLQMTLLGVLPVLLSFAWLCRRGLVVRNREIFVLYSPHLVSNCLREYPNNTLPSVAASTVNQKLLRLAAFPVTDSIAVNVHSGTQQAVLAALSVRDFLSGRAVVPI